jgi:SPASM domain peptide maturase of grasp-with-spasm system
MEYLLASNCFITKGHARSLLLDLQRYKQYIVSTELGELLNKRFIKKEEFPEKYRSIVGHLIEEDILLEIEAHDKELFPSMDIAFDIPSFINDAIIDVDNQVPDFKIIIKQLIPLLCRHIEIRFFSTLEINTLITILDETENTTIESIDVYLPYASFKKQENEFFHILEKNIRLRILYVHSSPKNGLIAQKNRLLFTSQEINSEKHCGVISKFLFSINPLTYFESLKYNTCLNRKIAIDVMGEIKNCPSMKKSYGNISETSLKEAMEKNGFKDLWNIHKEQITTCKDCEFRTICTDCRAYTENPEDMYSKPLKCGYNPYTTTWEEWSTNPLKQNAMKFYGLNSVSN